MSASPLTVTKWDLHSLLLWPSTTMHLDGNQFRSAILNKIECHEYNTHAHMRLPLPMRSLAKDITHLTWESTSETRQQQCQWKYAFLIESPSPGKLATRVLAPH